eukprot:5765807-Amphidinium_carterae.1
MGRSTGGSAKVLRFPAPSNMSASCGESGGVPAGEAGEGDALDTEWRSSVESPGKGIVGDRSTPGCWDGVGVSGTARCERWGRGASVAR